MERQPAQKRLADQNLAQDAARTTRLETQFINKLQKVSQSKAAVGTFSAVVLSSVVALGAKDTQANVEPSPSETGHELKLTGNQLEGTVFDPQILANLIDSRTQKPLNFGEDSNLPQASENESAQKAEMSFAGPTIIQPTEGISQALKRDLKERFGIELTPEQYFEGAKALAADNNKTGDINLVNTGDPFVWGEKTLAKLAEFGISGSSQVTTQASIENINTDTTIIFENSGEDTTSESQTEVTVNNQVENPSTAITSAQNSGEVSSAGVPGEGDLPSDDGGPQPGPDEGDLPTDDGGPQPGPDEGDLPTTEPKPDDPPDVPIPTVEEHPTLPPLPTVDKHPTLPPTKTPKFHATPTPPKKHTPTPPKKASPTPTSTKKATATPTNTPPKKDTATPTATATRPKKETPTPTSTATETATNTPTRTPVKKESPTPTPTKKETETPTPTLTKEVQPTPTLSPTATFSPTPTRTSEVKVISLPPTGQGEESENQATFGLLTALFAAIFGFLLPLGWILQRKYNSGGGEVND